MHYIAWLISQGAVPYRDAFDMNMPGVVPHPLGGPGRVGAGRSRVAPVRPGLARRDVRAPLRLLPADERSGGGGIGGGAVRALPPERRRLARRTARFPPVPVPPRRHLWRRALVGGRGRAGPARVGRARARRGRHRQADGGDPVGRLRRRGDVAGVAEPSARRWPPERPSSPAASSPRPWCSAGSGRAADCPRSGTSSPATCCRSTASSRASRSARPSPGTRTAGNRGRRSPCSARSVRCARRRPGGGAERRCSSSGRRAASSTSGRRGRAGSTSSIRSRCFSAGSPRWRWRGRSPLRRGRPVSGAGRRWRCWWWPSACCGRRASTRSTRSGSPTRRGGWPTSPATSGCSCPRAGAPRSWT